MAEVKGVAWGNKRGLIRKVFGMDAFERIDGKFGVWRSNFIPGNFGEGPVIAVPIENVVARYVRETNQHEYKQKLLDVWMERLRAGGVTLTDIQLDKAAWEAPA